MEAKVDILNKVKEIVSRYEVCDLEIVDNIDNINVSDLSKVQIAMEIERVFGVEFDFGDITKLRTVNELVTFIEEQNS